MDEDIYADAYQRSALITSKYKGMDNQFLGCVLGLAAEAGEVAGKIEKRIRKDMVSIRPLLDDDIVAVVEVEVEVEVEEKQ